MILKKNITNIFYLFLFSHLFLWTLIPSISNLNLPLDTIEALAWGSNLEWGFNKHPPLSAFIVSIFYLIFGSNDWSYYLLSQICVVISFLIVWKLSKDFFTNKVFSLLSIMLLETIVFFNYTTPEFNVYVCQLPLKAAAVYFFWKGLNLGSLKHWILTGVFCALGVLTHYSFIFIIISLFIYFIFFKKKNKKINQYFLISLIIFLTILAPHILWLIENNIETISYAFKRTGMENKSFISHFIYPIVFTSKQIGMLSIFFLSFLAILTIKKIKKLNFNVKDKKLVFLIAINFLPVIIIFLISFVSGAKIRTMWMSSFYLFLGLLLFYYFKNIIDIKKINNLLFVIVFFFFLSPVTYFYISTTNESKRTDYPGKEIARLVQNKWDDNFMNQINIVVGDEWYAGNLSYHLESRPIWYNEINEKIHEIKKYQGVIYTGNPSILKKICPGVFGTIKPVGYCMIGKK